MSVELAKGVYRTEETAGISVNPLEIRINSSFPPLFGDAQKERIGSDLVRLAKEHNGWVAVSADVLFGKEGLRHFSGKVDSMGSDGYIVLVGDNRDMSIEPTQELANFYKQQQSQLEA